MSSSRRNNVRGQINSADTCTVPVLSGDQLVPRSLSPEKRARYRVMVLDVLVLLLRDPDEWLRASDISQKTCHRMTEVNVTVALVLLNVGGWLDRRFVRGDTGKLLHEMRLKPEVVAQARAAHASASQEDLARIANYLGE